MWNLKSGMNECILEQIQSYREQAFGYQTGGERSFGLADASYIYYIG